MLRILTISTLLASAVGLAQTCLLTAPSAPPHAKILIVNLPGDGGTTGCTAYGTCPTCQASTTVPIGNAKCATAVAIAEQSVANDNGWNDGGVP